VDLADVEAALGVVHEVALRTPTRAFPGLETDEVFLKLENLQRLGAFKIRGAWNRMSRLSAEERRRGVATISSGNHGLAVAWSARRLGLPCVVHIPQGAAGPKVEAIRAQGAELKEMPRGELVRTHTDELWRSWPQTFIHPFAHPQIIAGQGTIGWELAEDLPGVRTVLVPVGGGGLSSGIAIAVKARIPGVKVFGVQAAGAATLPTVFQTKTAFRVEDPQTIADGIRIGIILPAMAELLLRNLDGCLVVSDAEIEEAMRRLALEAKIVAEPAGAAAFAAWIGHRHELEPPVAVIVSGGNVDPAFLARTLQPAAPSAPRPATAGSPSRSATLDRMTQALEMAKQARDRGVDVKELRKTLKFARAAFEAGDYATAMQLADRIIEQLRPSPKSR
jgi:threonine dehydratase